MDYTQKLSFHYRPKKGWINDPNGLVYFKGWYHVFYQHAPDSETPWTQPMHWGHARTQDFLCWEELPCALCPDRDYDRSGCWSGTAVVSGERLWLFYASVREEVGVEGKVQTVSAAWSEDGVHFEKYSGNPVIGGYPADGCPDFRDPAVCRLGEEYLCVMATGHVQTRTARLLLYRSRDLLRWEYSGVMSSWENGIFTECPSIVPDGRGGVLLSASVCPLEGERFFSVMYGRMENGRFVSECSARPDKGPDQYAGQVFRDHLGRDILLSWMPGWEYAGFAPVDIACMSAPRQLRREGNRVLAWPVEELCHLLREEDECLQRTGDGFVISRQGREPVVYRGEVRDLKILRDGYVAEVFVNGGEQVFSVLL